jgi:hypothetical protein
MLYIIKEEEILNYWEMGVHIIIGLALGFFGLWFFWFETIREATLNIFPIIANNELQWLRLSSELLVALVRIVFGAIVFLWMIFGCVIATIKQYQHQKLEALAREETRKLQEQMMKEAQERLAKMTDAEKEEAQDSGWLW